MSCSSPKNPVPKDEDIVDSNVPANHDDTLTLVPATNANAQTGSEGHIETPKERKEKWQKQGQFHEGLAWVKDANGKYGYIDKTGKLIIPCKWEWAGDFREDLASVADANWKHGYIDMTGKLVIPCQWEFAGSFYNGRAVVRDANGKEYKIDKMGMSLE